MTLFLRWQRTSSSLECYQREECAGIRWEKSWKESGTCACHAEIDLTFATNYTGPFLLTNLLQGKEGWVLTFCATPTFPFPRHFCAYCLPWSSPFPWHPDACWAMTQQASGCTQQGTHLATVRIRRPVMESVSPKYNQQEDVRSISFAFPQPFPIHYWVFSYEIV